VRSNKIAWLIGALFGRILQANTWTSVNHLETSMQPDYLTILMSEFHKGTLFKNSRPEALDNRATPPQETNHP